MASGVRGESTHCLTSLFAIVPLIALEVTGALVRPQVEHRGSLELSLVMKGHRPRGPSSVPGIVPSGAGITEMRETLALSEG